MGNRTRLLGVNSSILKKVTDLFVYLQVTSSLNYVHLFQQSIDTKLILLWLILSYIAASEQGVAIYKLTRHSCMKMCDWWFV